MLPGTSQYSLFTVRSVILHWRANRTQKETQINHRKTTLGRKEASTPF